MRYYDKAFQPPRPSDLPVNDDNKVIQFNIHPKRFSIELHWLFSAPSRFTAAREAHDKQALMQLVLTIHQTCPSVDAFDLVFGNLMFGYSDSLAISTVVSDQVNYLEVTEASIAAARAEPRVYARDFPTVNQDFDLLVDSIDFAEAIGAITVADTIYEEFKAVFRNVIMKVPQVEKLFRSGERMKRFILEWAFGFQALVRNVTWIGYTHKTAFFTAIDEIAGLEDFVDAHREEYADLGVPGARSMGIEVRDFIAERQEARLKRKSRRKGERPNKKRQRLANATDTGEEDVFDTHQSEESGEGGAFEDYFGRGGAKTRPGQTTPAPAEAENSTVAPGIQQSLEGQGAATVDKMVAADESHHAAPVKKSKIVTLKVRWIGDTTAAPTSTSATAAIQPALAEPESPVHPPEAQPPKTQIKNPKASNKATSKTPKQVPPKATKQATRKPATRAQAPAQPEEPGLISNTGTAPPTQAATTAAAPPSTTANPPSAANRIATINQQAAQATAIFKGVSTAAAAIENRTAAQLAMAPPTATAQPALATARAAPAATTAVAAPNVVTAAGNDTSAPAADQTVPESSKWTRAGGRLREKAGNWKDKKY